MAKIDFLHGVRRHVQPAELLRLMEIEVREPDFNKWSQLSHAGRPAGTLSEATAGDLDRSLRQREIRRPGGFSDELRVVLAGGRPFSTNSAVGSMVAGSVVIMQVPSAGTARPKASPTARAKSGTGNPR